MTQVGFIVGAQGSRERPRHEPCTLHAGRPGLRSAHTP